MKKRFFICLAGTMLTFAINPAFSQKADIDLSTDSLFSVKEVTSALPIVSPGHMNEISSKAIRDFIRRYDFTTDEKWYKLTKGYIASFKKDSIDFKVSYDARGQWVSTIRTYTEKYLPSAVRHPIKSAHYDYNIYLVREIESDDHPLVYFIYLRKAENETSFKNIMYSDGEMQEVEPYKGKWREKSFSFIYG